MKANQISDILLKEYYPKGRHFCSTNFTGCGLSECDVIMVTEARVVYEYEIKCTNSDFKADFKKTYKHLLLSGKIEGKFTDDGWFTIPNHFYYCCLPNIIKLEEIPSYAGLIYIIDGKPMMIKKAPKIHKNKASDRLIFQICRNLTARMIYGCSFMNYKINVQTAFEK